MVSSTLHSATGPQNKKTSLDGFFASYEDEVPNKQKWLALFEDARALTVLIVPRLVETRWRGKSDYYSLFLACGSLISEGLQLKKKTAAGKAIATFGAQVTLRLTKEGVAKSSPKAVVQYARAVEKAASDKDRRHTRHELLRAVLRPYFK